MVRRYAIAHVNMVRRYAIVQVNLVKLHCSRKHGEASVFSVDLQHLREAADVDASLDDDGCDSADHDSGLQHVCPHHRLVTSLQSTGRDGG